MKAAPHPIVPAPTWHEINRLAEREGWDTHQALAHLTRIREGMIAEEEMDPLRCGYDPPIWKVCDALIDFPFAVPGFEEEL